MQQNGLNFLPVRWFIALQAAAGLHGYVSKPILSMISEAAYAAAVACIASRFVMASAYFRLETLYLSVQLRTGLLALSSSGLSYQIYDHRLYWTGRAFEA